jgi:DNA excision repair protein ERCC-3
MSGWKADHQLGGRSSRASKRATPVPGIEDVGSSDEYSDYVDEKDDNLKGKRKRILSL